MAPVMNGRILYNENPAPTGYPIPGETTVYDESQTIDLDGIPLNGGVLTKTLVISIDPYLRNKMREDGAVGTSFKKGEPLANWGVGVVIRSEDSSVKVGDHVYGMFPFQHYSIFPDAKSLRLLANEEKLSWSVYVGVAGMPGMTAYYGWKAYAAPQDGDTVFVTAGAGPVGSFVIQLAKQAGLKVIASAGTEDKVTFLKSIGADVAFNYKTTNTSEVLEKEGPINIYWDNVGGETLDAALRAAADRARFLECGMISQYNSKPPRMSNLMMIVRKELRINGVLVNNMPPEYVEEFYSKVPRWIANGQMKYLEDATKGLEYAGHALLDVQKGKNNGKSVVVVADE